MTRQSHHKVDANDLANFHYRAPSSDQNGRQGGSGSAGRGVDSNRSRQRNQNQNHRSRGNRPRNDNRQNAGRNQDSNKRLKNRFYLLSSPDHAFVLTRIPGKHQTRTFQGPDTEISWSSVRMVKSLTAVEERCPICLDDFVCPRISKCGHSFCLSCILHHEQSHLYGASSGIKCPCCSAPLFLDDMRPVTLVSTLPSQTITMVKLHRMKTCYSPYLPRPEEPRRGAPHAAPCQTDHDAPYCKFNYVCPDLFLQHLHYNLHELQSASIGSGIEQVCQRLAMERVQNELQTAYTEQEMEGRLKAQFEEPSGGVYQRQPPHMIVAEQQQATEQAAIDCTKSEYIPDTGTPMETGLESNQIQDNGEEARKSPGSMRQGDNEFAFYQAQDGSLCFLTGFAMNSLKFEFDVLPDTITGKVLQCDRLHLDSRLRSKFRFLSHLPEESDITFVELSVAHLLSKKTKKHFAKDFQKRQHARQKTIQEDKRVDQKKKRAEEARIEKLKSRLQVIDPNDHFFHASVPVPQQPMSLTGEDFGPSLTRSPETTQQPMASSPQTRNGGLSFSQIARERVSVRSLSIEDDFPTLQASVGKKSLR